MEIPMNDHERSAISFEIVLHDLYDRLFDAGEHFERQLAYRSTVLPDGGHLSPCLEEVIRKRRSTRRRSGVTMTPAEICSMLMTALGVTSHADRHGYAVPAAGAIRELRYFVCVRSVPLPQLFEFVPEAGHMAELDGILFEDIAIEDWERDSIFNLIFCYQAAAKRSYSNNLLHLAFEAGCASQNIGLLSAAIDVHHCVSGILNVRAFRSMFGSAFVPLHMISIM